MASNLSSIGFAYDDDETFTADMTKLAEQAAAGGSGKAYAVWHSPNGAELWFHVKADGSQIVGLTPFFDGTSKVSIRVQAIFQRPGDSDFEGAVTAWVAPGDDEQGTYPIVFDAPDYLAIPRSPEPFVGNARIVGFAHQLRAFPNAEAYSEAQPDDLKFAPQAFIPIGMFATEGEDGDDAPPPSSSAMVTGTVSAHKVLSNDITGQTFHALAVETLEATIDIVADPAIMEGTISKGCTVEVSCTLFGRLLA